MVFKGDFKQLTEAEIGARPPRGSDLHKLVSVIAFLWSLFQIWVASPIQFDVAKAIGSSFFIFNDSQIRSVHLSIGIFLVFLLFPAFEKSPDGKVPFIDWVFALVSSACVFYLCIFYNQIAMRLGLPTQIEIVLAVIGILLLLEAARRTVGSAIAIIASLFLLYCKFGEIMPSLIIHKDYSIAAIVSHQWFSAEGVFGTALGVSAGFVFLYVLFGALLEKTGAGNFFIRLSFALLGRFRGGPAKAAVVSSGLMGMISGSSIANTITIGSLTIPLMKKMGFTAEKAGAIEVSAGINGQIMPPVMGAAAFLMAEYLSIPYVEVIKHAFLPAVLIYIALLYIVHIEACTLDIQPRSSSKKKPLFWGVMKFFLSFFLITIASGILYFIIEGANTFLGIKDLAGKNSVYVIGGACILIYMFLLKYEAQYKSREVDITKDLNVWLILKSGLHHFLPLVILIWCLLVERMSPALSAYWTVIFLLFELATKDSIIAFFNKTGNIKNSAKRGLIKFADGMIMGARNMTVVAIATATAGIIVGSVSLTGLGLKISGVLDYLSNGSFILTLFFTAFICIVLGMGMPTTACYIIVATLMVPVLRYITEKNAIYVPLFAMHLFVFYFGLMADVTPPVGLASYAASAIAGGNAISTGVQAFFYNIRTMVLPFLFVINSEILLFGISGFSHLMQVIVFSVLGIVAITGGSQGYFLERSKLYESVLLVGVGISMMCPQIPINIITSPFIAIEIDENILSYKNDTDKLQVIIDQRDFFGKIEKWKVNIDTKATKGQTIKEQLKSCGISARYSDGSIDIISVASEKDSPCDIVDISSKINDIKIGHGQISRFYIYIFSLAIFLAIWVLQRRRS